MQEEGVAAPLSAYIISSRELFTVVLGFDFKLVLYYDDHIRKQSDFLFLVHTYIPEY